MGDGSDGRAATLLARMEGRWGIAREIEDHLTGEQSVFAGEAVFAWSGSGLAYCETGALRLPGRAPLRGERRYLWCDCGDAVGVFFDDGRPFHRFAPAGGSAEHWCAPDRYRVRYGFDALSAAPPAWDAAWTVVGPRKNYMMQSRYTRL
ncbi:MAG: DUF6314 family protein [Pseudomonadota bacterium]